MRKPIESVLLTADDAVLLLRLVRKLISLSTVTVCMAIASVVLLI